MMLSAHWRGMAFPVLCLAIAACGKPGARANAADPNTPAVVKAPPVILPGDTVKKVATTVVSMQTAKTTTARNYALLGAAISFGDQQMIGAQYAPNATLTTAAGNTVGNAAIVHVFKELKGLKDFTRVSRVTTIADSTVIDSGTYTIVLKRAGADSTVERGSYSSVWRIQPEPIEWFMSRDHLYSAPRKAK